MRLGSNCVAQRPHHLKSLGEPPPDVDAVFPGWRRGQNRRRCRQDRAGSPCTSASEADDPLLPKSSRATTVPSPGDAARYGVAIPISLSAAAMPVARTAVSFGRTPQRTRTAFSLAGDLLLGDVGRPPTGAVRSFKPGDVSARDRADAPGDRGDGFVTSFDARRQVPRSFEEGDLECGDWFAAVAQSRSPRRMPSPARRRRRSPSLRRGGEAAP